jgi:DNA-binding transcriptional regulator YiaG
MPPDERAHLSRNVPGKRVESAERRKVLAMRLSDELKHARRSTQIAQPVFAQVL